MSNFFKLHLEIRHADWPYILQGFITFFILSILGYFLFNEDVYQYFLLLTSLVFIIFTAVHFNNLRKEEMEHFRYKVQVLQELNSLLPIRAPLPPMVGWAATPELAINIYKIIEEMKPALIVELGSGVSTIISAYTLEKFNPEGKVISFDHDADFANRTQKELNLHGLDDFVNIYDAPLSPISLHNKNWRWYNIGFTKIDRPVDLLIIDGPPLKTQKNARYPALPSFYEKLSDRAVVILHDTDRDNETETVHKWLDEYPDLQKTCLRTEKGITILRKTNKN